MPVVLPYHCFCIVSANISTVKKGKECLSYYENSFDLIDPLKKSHGPPGFTLRTASVIIHVFPRQFLVQDFTQESVQKIFV